MADLERRTSASTAAATTGVLADLERFQDMLLDRLDEVGLPTDGVLVDVDEREQALVSVGGALRHLPLAERSRSVYVSKMIAACASGLFDAALNYLWNETVGELRRRVAGYDLDYFYDVAVTSAEQRRHLKDADDLPKVADVDLLRGALSIGLLTATGHAQLDHIRYMRNYASAAHPNQVELTGLQLAAWLETCIRQVITRPYDEVTAQTGRLLGNIKATRLSEDEAAATAVFFEGLASERADALAAGLFGLYTDAKASAVVADNVRLLWPALWPHVSEDARYGFGTRYGRFVSIAATDQATAARDLLEKAGGAAYVPESMRAANIDSALDALRTAHHGWDNFHTEGAPARALAAQVGDRGDIPVAVTRKYVQTLVEVYLGNGYGVSWAADPVYSDLLDLLTPDQAGVALRSFTDPTISARLWSSKPQQRWAKLLDRLGPKLTRERDLELLAAVRASAGSPDKLSSDSRIATLLRRPAPAARRRP